ncbi:hypothetical protein JHK85_016802 [Glycine max]|nr:hypothetical protein JHK85_016802 [Glycine max]
MEHKPSVSTIGWDMNLLAAAYDGKHKENKEKETEITIEVLKCCSENRMTLETVVEDAETNNDIEMQKGEASRKLRVAIGVQKV